MASAVQRNLMVLGTASNVGKGTITTALCRWLRRNRVSVAPFKAMNPLVTDRSSLENRAVHREQAYQAVAAGIEPHADMNPILVGFCGSLPVFRILGKEAHDLDSLDLDERADALRAIVKSAYDRLSNEYSFIAIEGCGSPVELNLMHRDFVNLWLAEEVDANCLLVTSAEHGGAFAAAMGTLALLNPNQRKRIQGLIINKFSGQTEDFKEGVRLLEKEARVECVGVIPFFPGLDFLGRENPKRHSHELVNQEIDGWTDHVVSHLRSDFLTQLIS
jgi:adenosylcobyric acid synthase